MGSNEHGDHVANEETAYNEIVGRLRERTRMMTNAEEPLVYFGGQLEVTEGDFVEISTTPHLIQALASGRVRNFGIRNELDKLERLKNRLITLEDPELFPIAAVDWYMMPVTPALMEAMLVIGTGNVLRDLDIGVVGRWEEQDGFAICLMETEKTPVQRALLWGQEKQIFNYSIIGEIDEDPAHVGVTVASIFAEGRDVFMQYFRSERRMHDHGLLRELWFVRSCVETVFYARGHDPTIHEKRRKVLVEMLPKDEARWRERFGEAPPSDLLDPERLQTFFDGRGWEVDAKTFLEGENPMFPFDEVNWTVRVELNSRRVINFESRAMECTPYLTIPINGMEGVLLEEAGVVYATQVAEVERSDLPRIYARAKELNKRLRVS